MMKEKRIDFFVDYIICLIVGVLMILGLVLGVVWQLFDEISLNKLGFYSYGKK